MWLFDAVLVLVILALAAWVGHDLLTLPRHDEAAGETPAARPRAGLLIVALLLLLADAVVGTFTALGDAGLGPWRQDSYQILGLVIGSGQIGVAALAMALRSLAAPRATRSRASAVTTVVMFVIVFGIAACYGTMLSM